MQNSKTLIDLILTNKPKSVLAKNALDNGISDVHHMVCAVLPGQILKKIGHSTYNADHIRISVNKNIIR